MTMASTLDPQVGSTSPETTCVDAGIGSCATDQVSHIAEWYAGRSILITGATGFMGKVLVEKLLRSCPNVRAIYVLVRVKRGIDTSQRLDDLINSMVFDKLRDSNPNQLSKVIGIKGDVTLPGLGLRPEDAETLRREVSVVFHMAANVRFDQKLKSAVNLIIGGTQRVLEAVETFEHVDAFVHVSTAYCHCNESVLEERTYETPYTAEAILQTCQWMPDAALDSATPKLLDFQPNTYAYTKRLTESLVASKADKLPVCIARPSIVAASWRDPMPGWIENLNGPTGLIVGAGKGVIRSMHCNENYNADVMPADITINALVAVAWHMGNNRPKSPYVCNLTQSEENPITWRQCLALGRKHVYENPFSLAIWYPDGSPKASKFQHMLCVIFFHFLPAYFIDFLLILIRKKPFMVKLQERIQSGLTVLTYYGTRSWVFRNTNLKSLRKKVRTLSPKDEQEFYMDIGEMNWDQYMKNYVLGAREFCLKEDPSTIPAARKTLRKLYILDRSKNLMLMAFITWLVYSYAFIVLNLVETFFAAATDLIL